MNEDTSAVQPVIEQSAQDQKPSNVYRYFRMIFFVLSILFFLGMLVFLVYYNGKSIYAHGL